MKKVYETAADMILSGIVFAALIAIILGAALLDKAGRRMKVESEDFSVMEESMGAGRAGLRAAGVCGGRCRKKQSCSEGSRYY